MDGPSLWPSHTTLAPTRDERTTRARDRLTEGLVIPAHPLALTAARKLDEPHQRALTRYYVAAGAGGLAVGVHTTQFAIRGPGVGLLPPVLELAAETSREAAQPPVLVAGICGRTQQAVAEAELAASLGYDAGLLSLPAMRDADDGELSAHCRAVGEAIPLFGFYLQPAVGGRPLSYAFWRRFAELESAVAIKIAPFNRYQSLDVLRAVADAGAQGRIALYTGNDDSIISDLVTPFRVGGAEVRIVGGLLGQWAVGTRRAVELLARVKEWLAIGRVPVEGLALGQRITDTNAALFDAANGFAGCIAGIHEVLRRQGLVTGRWCLDPREDLSPGQHQEIDRVLRAYPELHDDEFIAEHLDAWLR